MLGTTISVLMARTLAISLQYESTYLTVTCTIFRSNTDMKRKIKNTQLKFHFIQCNASDTLFSMQIGRVVGFMPS